MTDGLVFLPSYYDAIRGLPDAERLQMYDAIVQYGIYGELPELPPILNAAFLFCKPNIDNAKARHSDAVANGKKGGRPCTKAKPEQEPTLASEAEQKPEQEPILKVEPENKPEQIIQQDGFQTKNQKQSRKQDPYLMKNQEIEIEIDKEMDKEMDKDREIETDKDTYRGRESTERRADRPPSARRFLPPSVDEVKAFCKERGSRVDAQRFVDFYTAKGWRIGKDPMKDWQAAVRTWEQRDKANFRDITSPDRYLADLEGCL